MHYGYPELVAHASRLAVRACRVKAIGERLSARAIQPISESVGLKPSSRLQVPAVVFPHPRLKPLLSRRRRGTVSLLPDRAFVLILGCCCKAATVAHHG